MRHRRRGAAVTRVTEPFRDFTQPSHSVSLGFSIASTDREERPMPSMKLWTIAAFVVAPCALASAASADDAKPSTDREKELEKRVEDLEKQLADVNRRLSQSGSNAAGDELEARVAELEKVTKKDKDGLFAYWGNGVRMDSASGAFKLKIGGRIQNDWSWFQHATSLEQDYKQQIEAGTEFRRARLYMGGTIYGNVDFMGEYDFAGGSTQAREVWIGLAVPCVGHFQVGSMKEPFGLEEQTSDLFINMLERHAPSEAFAPSYNTGFMLSNTCAENRVAWAAGVFRDADNFGNDTGNTRSGEYNFTARVTGRPWIAEEGTRYLHLGVAGSERTPSSDTVQFRAHPELHLAPYFVDTGKIEASKVRLFEGESAFVSGPFHCEAEYYLTFVDGTGAGYDATFQGWSAQGGWFITGESRPYKTDNGTFGRVAPKKNFDGKGGAGAWEVVARVDSINLNDAQANGGHMQTVSAGVNWYLNPNTRVMLDWVHADVIDVGWMNGLEMRFQVDF
jgi:phosphate-selective porin OprO/OprP